MSQLIFNNAALTKRSNAFKEVIGCTANIEKAYYSLVCEHAYQGSGAVVDLGCFLGSTTRALVHGLSLNRNWINSPEPVVHAFDIFRWEPWMTSLPFVTNHPVLQTYQQGDSFLNYFITLNTDISDSIVIHEENLCVPTWDGSIEILLVDAIKSEKLMQGICSTFYPALLPEVSIILHQDFNWQEVYCQISCYLLREYFEYICSLPHNGTVSFRCIKAIPDDIDTSTLLSAMTHNDYMEAFYWARQYLPESGADGLFALIRYLCGCGLLAEARKEFILLEKEYDVEALRLFSVYKKELFS